MRRRSLSRVASGHVVPASGHVVPASGHVVPASGHVVAGGSGWWSVWETKERGDEGAGGPGCLMRNFDVRFRLGRAKVRCPAPSGVLGVGPWVRAPTQMSDCCAVRDKPDRRAQRSDVLGARATIRSDPCAEKAAPHPHRRAFRLPTQPSTQVSGNNVTGGRKNVTGGRKNVTARGKNVTARGVSARRPTSNRRRRRCGRREGAVVGPSASPACRRR